MVSQANSRSDGDTVRYHTGRASDFPLVHERDTFIHDFIGMSLSNWLKSAPPLAPHGPGMLPGSRQREERARLEIAEIPLTEKAKEALKSSIRNRI